MINFKKRKIDEDAEKKCEVKFYRYLVLILIILFSCIFTFSNLINPEETRDLIWELVRRDYNDFFRYEIENNESSIDEIYELYSKNKDIEVETLMALNTMYFGKYENRYLEAYIRPYIDRFDLKQDERIKLYKKVNTEIKNIERKYTCILSFKRFLPYIVSLIFLIVLMYISSIIHKFDNNNKRIITLLLFFIGGLICIFSILNLKEGIWINIAILLGLIEFTIENKINIVKYMGGALALIILSLSIFRIQYDRNNIASYDADNLFLSSNLEKVELVEEEQDIQRGGQALYSEIKKEKLILIGSTTEELKNLVENESKVVFISKEDNMPIFYLCLYNGLPVYRLVFVKDGYIERVYEGVLNPYMKSTLRSLEKFDDSEEITPLSKSLKDEK